MKAILIVMLALLVAVPANAREKWDFGRIDYGARVKTQPSGVTNWHCDGDGGCGFTDDSGVEYITWEGKVVIKTFVVTETRKQLPFGLDLDNDMKTNMAQISQKTGLTFNCDTHATNPNIAADVVSCDTAVVGGDPGAWLILTFGVNGKLREMEIFTHYI